ncbi:MAG: non-homologous end-joining DNA ligase [Nocardiopsaceae bacterium]|jgi:bifunctional non-homologous end joining protein LigD|nr:non-homologous end-joining DNA ligase [Nocardiopsaceae bacterium]
MAGAPAPSQVGLSRPGKVLFPGDGITKGDLAGYYRQVAARMLPYLRGRPLALARFPDGITGQRIFQKNVSPHSPDWLPRTEVGKRDGTVCQVIADNEATLVYLANQACVELHPFLSRAGRLDRPDQFVLDLDPPGAGHFRQACQAALAARDLLEDELGLTTYVMTTGGKGVHIRVPLAVSGEFGQAREFGHALAALLAARHPGLITAEQRRERRGDRVYADIMRNSYAQTAVAPFSVRARPGATVAAPLDWSEVPDRGLRPDRFTLRTIGDRLAATGGGSDPWAGIRRRRYSLGRAGQRLARLTG